LRIRDYINKYCTEVQSMMSQYIEPYDNIEYFDMTIHIKNWINTIVPIGTMIEFLSTSFQELDECQNSESELCSGLNHSTSVISHNSKSLDGIQHMSIKILVY